MSELGREAPTVLVLEDLHWADEATLDVVKLLGRRVSGVPVLVVGTYRDDELHPTHPLRVVLGELAADAAVERLEVELLSPAAVAALAAPQGVDAAELYRKTEGNPFYVTEALAVAETEIPPTVRDAVLARVGRLGAQARVLLEAVAVVPQKAELWLLEAMVGEAVDRIEECAASGVLHTMPYAVSFRHELARLAVEESLTPTAGSDSTGRPWQRSPPLRLPPSTSPGLRTTPKPAATQRRCSSSHLGRRWERRCSVRTARPRRSTSALSGSPAQPHRRHRPNCTRVARTSAI